MDSENKEEIEILDINNDEETNSTEDIVDTENVEELKDDNVEESPKKVETVKKEVVKEKTITKTVEEKKDNSKKEKKDDKDSKKDQKVKETTKKDENNTTVVKEVIVKKSSVVPTIVMIIVFLLLIGAIFALPYINDFFEQKRNPVSNENQTNTTETTEQPQEEFKSGIDVKEVLTNIKDTKSYQYKNTINLYVKDENNESFAIQNDYTYSFNETKYKVENNKDVGDFTYNTIDYYEKLDDKYYIYQNDITDNSYSKDEITNDKFNTIYNLFTNTINYLLNNYEITSEKQIDNKINITLKVNKKLLENLSYETSRIKNTIDSSKLSIDNIVIDLYFNKNKELESIEFEVEDKNIYQDDIEGNVESAISKYTFNSFNSIKDIELPSV